MDYRLDQNTGVEINSHRLPSVMIADGNYCHFKHVAVAKDRIMAGQNHLE